MLAIAQVMVLVQIMLTVLVLDPRSIDTFTLPKSVASHATSLAIAALLIWLLVRHGRELLRWSPIYVGAGAFLLTFAFATLAAADPEVAFFGTFRRYLGLTQAIDDVFLVVAVSVLFRQTRALRLLVGVCVGLAVPVLGYALIQRAGLDPLSFVQGQGIPISTLGNPDISGAVIALIGASAIGFAVLVPGARFSWQRIVLAVIGLACAGGLLITGVRAGILAFAGGLVAAILLTLWSPNVPRKRVAWVLAIGAGLGVAVILSPVGARLSPSRLVADRSFVSRVDAWSAAAKAIIERPVLGWGPDNFVAAYPSRRTGSSIPSQVLENSTHDVWLYVATSAGIVGLAGLLFLIILSIDRGVRLASQGHIAALALVPLLAYLGQALVNVNEIAIDQFFWISIGVLAGSEGSAALSRRARPPRQASAFGALLLALAAFAALLTGAPRIEAGEGMLAAEAYTNAGRADEGVPFGALAVSADPRRGDAWSTYGSALYHAGDGFAAVLAFEKAAELQPWQPLAWRNLAIAWDAAGNRDAAYAAAARGPVADPYDGVAHEVLAQIAYEEKDYSRSAQEGERAIAYEFPAQASAYFTTISAYVQLKQLDQAERLARRAVEIYPTAELRLQLAAILSDEGKKTEALAVVDALLQDQPKNAAALALKDAIETR